MKLPKPTRATLWLSFLCTMFLTVLLLLGCGCSTFVTALKAENTTGAGERSSEYFNKLDHPIQVFNNKKHIATLEPKIGYYWFKQGQLDTNAVTIDLVVKCPDKDVTISFLYESETRDMTQNGPEHKTYYITEQLLFQHASK